MAGDAKSSGTPADVVHNASAGRFEIREGESLAVLEYAIDGGRIAMFHTGVPVELEGRGYGSRLVKAALEHAKAEGLRVVPQCSFVRTYINRHPEWEPLVDAG